MKQEGDNETAKHLRQERVYRLLLRGLTVREIAKEEGVGERTIQRDAQQVKTSLMQSIQAQQLRTHKLALAELEEVWRELWTLYKRPPREIPREQNGTVIMTKEDDRPIKTALLMALMKVSEAKNRLIFQTPTPPIQTSPPSSQQSSERIIADFIDTLPEKLRGEVVDVVKKRSGASEENP